jgi:hypothetical protein
MVIFVQNICLKMFEFVLLSILLYVIPISILIYNCNKVMIVIFCALYVLVGTIFSVFICNRRYSENNIETITSNLNICFKFDLEKLSTVENFNEEICPICLEDNTDTIIIILNCGHRLHQICGEENLKYRKSCCICRTEIAEITEMTEIASNIII